ncbi:MAG: DUF6510 family protein [Anaerolineae bacterium]|jgi:hypothetical protein
MNAGMQEDPNEVSRSLVQDGNAVAGLLYEVFWAEMTDSPTECAHCGYQGEIGQLMLFAKGPGAVLRCPQCHDVVLRVVTTPDAAYIDARGATYLRIRR